MLILAECNWCDDQERRSTNYKGKGELKEGNNSRGKNHGYLGIHTITVRQNGATYGFLLCKVQSKSNTLIKPLY